MATQTVYQYTQEQLPQFYLDHLQNVLGRGQSLLDAQGQAPVYGGQRIADFSPQQLAAFDYVNKMQGMGRPLIQSAMDLTGQAASGSAFDTAGQYVDPAKGLFQASAAQNTAGIYDPYAMEASGLARNVAGQGALGLGSPYIQGATSISGLGAASPYLSMAATSFPQMAGAYMSPYTQGVTDEIARLGARNLSERLLPAINDDFIRAGQYLSSGNQDFVGRALRDTQESVLGQQRQALESGYGMAGQLYGQDAARYAGLGSTAGGLTGQQQQTLLGAGTALSGIGSQDLARQLESAGLLSNIGQFGTSAAAADAQRQLQAGQGLAGLGQMAIGARQSDLDRMLQASAAQAGLATTAQNLTLQQIAALENVGRTQQGLQQQSLDTAYNDWQQQQQYPQDQISWYNNLIRGLPTGSTTTSQTTQPGPSTTSQIAAIGLGLTGLANSGILKAEGGPVRSMKLRKYRFAQGGRVGGLGMLRAA